MLNDLQQSMAKRSFSGNLKTRKIMFEKYQILLDNGMSYKEITERLLKRLKKKGTPEAAFLRHVTDCLNEGQKFSDALHGWSNSNEILIISAGEESGQDVRALKQCVELMEKLIEMKKTIIKSSIYPGVLFFALFVIIYAFANFMVPILTDFSEIKTWDSSAQNLANFSLSVSENMVGILTFFIVLFFVVKKSLGSFTGPLRDNVFDRIPPYNIYKEIQSGLFLVSLATLLKSGISFKKSLEFILNESPDYLENKVDEILDNINSGLGEGAAMNTDFIGDVGDDIEDFAAGSTIEDTLSKIGDRVVNEKIEKIEGSAGLLKTFAMVSVVIYILWAYSSFISITQNIQV